MQITQLGLIVTLAAARAVTAYGCSNCAGADLGRVRGGCLQACNEAFTTGTSERGFCRDECPTVVADDKCCVATCAGSRNTCVRDSLVALAKGRAGVRRAADAEQLDRIRRDPRLLDVRALALREPPYDAVETTEQLRALDPRGLRGWTVQGDGGGAAAGALEKRVNPGVVCCKTAKTIMAGAGALLPTSMVLSEMTDEETVAAMVLVAFGAAGTYACSRAYQINCVFDGTVPTPTNTVARRGLGGGDGDGSLVDVF
ncbi:hypothetical protein K490DRAFT_5277 [Neofusicoccum parvum]|nr:hypothetical protein K490DRAFT_5277 [Neofusicoccum parvum]